MSRIILHLDLDAFFCAVEAQSNPKLKGKAFAVGGRPQQRGVVASCSYEARAFGVHSAMPMSQAVRLCPDLIIVPQHFEAYHKASEGVMTLLNTITPLVEQISIDEAFLDVTGIKGTGYQIAARIQQQINTDLGLPCSFGVAGSKLVAKIANNLGKGQVKTGHAPNAILEVPAGKEAEFLAGLPVQELWGVGPKTGEQLHRIGIQTIGDISKHSQQDLIRRFGKIGGEIYLRAQGLDDRPVTPERDAKSISKETTFVRDENNRAKLEETIRILSEGVGRSLRHSHLAGTTIKLKLRSADFSTITRQLTLRQAVDQDQEIYEVALQLFHEAWTNGSKLRLIGVGVTGLDEAVRQLELWETEESKQARQFQMILDDLQGRFGDQSIKRGSDLKRKQ